MIPVMKMILAASFLASEGKTLEEHLKIAEHWEARAVSLEAQAVEYERKADEFAKRKDNNPMRHKWPAMAQGPVDHLRAKAMQARRAANESRGRMAHHRNLAEKLRTVAP
jgi:hypothetical protein